MLNERDIVRIPQVDFDVTEGACDSVGKVRRGWVCEKARACKRFGGGLLFVLLPLDRPVFEGGETVVVLEILVEIDSGRFAGHAGLHPVGAVVRRREIGL